MADVREQLTRLLKIQDLVLAMQDARAAIDGAPGRIEAAEQQFRERNAEYVAIKERNDALEADRAARTEDLTVLEESRKKFMDSLMQVKNQREYAAVLKEIDTVKARMSENEDAILKAMEEIESLRGELESRASHIETERAIVEQEHNQVEASVARAEETLARCEGERAALEAGLPPNLVLAVRRVEEGRRGIFLARAVDASCSSCHVRIRPQVYQEIRQAARLHACGNCKRFLYDERALASPAPSPAGQPKAQEVEALNGGSV